MPLGLSPYVTSTCVSQENRSNARMENDRPSPLRISKQINSTTHTRGGNYDQHPVYPAQEFIHPLQKHSANHLNISKRRSLWALSSQLVDHEEPRDIPPRPYSVTPNMALAARFSPMPDEKSERKVPRPAEEAEEMLREASRTYSGASDNSNSWNSFVSGGCSERKMSSTRSTSSVVRHVSSSTDVPSCTISMDSILPHVLSPHISIYTNGHNRYFGQVHVWAAIEVSGILSHAYSADGTGAKLAQPREDEHHLGRGAPCERDCRVASLSRAGISDTLILAQIRINPELIARRVSKAHRRHKSDELMADLESQLGDSQMPYMKVKVTYSHSAFSDYFGHEILVGVAQRCTKLETTAVGALKQHNVGSAWSPPPIYSLESIKSAMQRHWKADVVAKWLQRIKDSERAGIQQSTKHGDNAAEELQEANCRDPMHRPAISMETMCQKMTANRLSESCRHVQSPDYGNERRELKPATNMGSLRSRRSWSRNTSGTTCTSGSLRKKKSFAAGIWRTLTPSINIPKTEGDGSAQGPWNWNAWF
ncbi:uncharacterized protein BBA_01497 [Beauveria bassiana ARSEF 2860]|uniref:Uncharacterized protein n=1 Tax=Beauveria bassiana (strain ARSEF 2860) TaxID=655819 RepID=J4UU92_BEAB2|nr:uncharacterized protein BBA_01497 [Beauveria bassiana ARSEF 2860]EJP69532.1 hypothetical protein BBA_01497 [Beauveria bassiana ARSEF 2860]